MKWFPWTRAYQRDEWLDQLRPRSDHAALEPEVLDRLLEAIGAAIDDCGGSFVMNFETVLITATRLGYSRGRCFYGCQAALASRLLAVCGVPRSVSIARWAWRAT